MVKRVVEEGVCLELRACHYIRSENGPEFIPRNAQNWLDEMGIGTIFIEPGSPWQNPFAESFPQPPTRRMPQPGA